MKKDIFAIKGEVSVLEKEFEELCVLADNSIITIRENLNPFNMDNDFTELKIKAANYEMDQLYETYNKATEILKKINKLKNTLKEIKGAL